MRNHEVGAGLAIALGIMAYRPAAPELRARIKKAKCQERALGYYAQALGRIGRLHEARRLLATARDEKGSATSRAGAIAALGLIADPAPVPWHSPSRRS